MTDLTPLVVVPAWILGAILSTTVHELGHAAAAWLCRVPVRVFSIGSQRPPILRWRQGGTRVEIRPWFQGGYVAFYPMLRHRPFALLAVLLGGIAGNLIACLLLSWLLNRLPDAADGWSPLPGLSPAAAEWVTVPLPEPDPRSNALGYVLAILFLTQLLDIAVNLWPHIVRSPDGVLFWSDGLQVLDLLRGGPAAQVRVAGEGYRQGLALLGMEAGPAALQSRIAPILYHWAAAPLPDRIARDEKRAALLRLLSRPELTPAETLLIHAMLATDVTLYCDHDLMQAAEPWSRAALRLSDAPAVRAIRAAVLAETGKPAEAAALLDPIADDGGLPLYRFYRGMYLARALQRLGRPEEAGDWFARARPTDPAVWAISHALQTDTAALLGLPPEEPRQGNLPPVPDSLFQAVPGNDDDPEAVPPKPG